MPTSACASAVSSPLFVTRSRSHRASIPPAERLPSKQQCGVSSPSWRARENPDTTYMFAPRGVIPGRALGAVAGAVLRHLGYASQKPRYHLWFRADKSSCLKGSGWPGRPSRPQGGQVTRTDRDELERVGTSWAVRSAASAATRHSTSRRQLGLLVTDLLFHRHEVMPVASRWLLIHISLTLACARFVSQAKSTKRWRWHNAVLRRRWLS